MSATDFTRFPPPYDTPSDSGGKALVLAADRKSYQFQSVLNGAGGPNCVLWHADGTFDQFSATANTGAARWTAYSQALAKSISGDAIHVLAAGTYDNSSANPLIVKTGVNVYLAPGVVMQYSGTSMGGMIDDTANGTNGAIVCTIWGGGILRENVPGQTSSGDRGMINIENSSSVVSVECESIELASNGTTGIYIGAIQQKKGKIYVRCHRQIAVTTGDLSYPLIWWVDGDCHVQSPIIASSSNVGSTLGAIHSVQPNTNSGTGFLWVEANQITVPSADPVITTSGPNVKARVWVRAKEIVGSLNIAANKVYVDCEKIHGFTNPTVIQSGGILWLHAEKCTSDNVGWINFSGGTGYYDVNHYESDGNDDSTAGGWPGAGMVVSGGTLNLLGGIIDPLQDFGSGTLGDMDAIHCSAGALNLTGVAVSSGNVAKDLVQSSTGAITLAADCTFTAGKTTGTIKMSGFFGAAALAKPSVTGSKGANAALTSLLAALSSLGLVTDSST